MFTSQAIRNTVYIAIEIFLADNGAIRLPQMEFSMQIGTAGEFFYNALEKWKADNYIAVKAPNKKQADILDELMHVYNFHQANHENVLYFATETPAKLNEIVIKLNKAIAEHSLEGTFHCILTEEDGTIDYWNVTKDGIELADAPIIF